MTGDEFENFFHTYYKSGSPDQVPLALTYFVTENPWPESSLPLGLYFFARIAQSAPQLVRSYEALLPQLSTNGVSVLLQVLHAAGDDGTREFLVSCLENDEYSGQHGAISEILKSDFPQFQSALLRPVRDCLDLDLLWIEFLVTGNKDAVVTIIDVLDWPDLVRVRRVEWQSSESELTVRGQRHRKMNDLEEEVELVLYNVDQNEITAVEDLDTRFFLNGVHRDPDRSERIRELLPFSLTGEELNQVAVKVAAKWSLASNASQHSRVLEICVQQAQEKTVSAKLALLEIQAEAYSSVGNLDLGLEAIRQFIELSPGNTAMLNLQQYLLSALPEDDGDEDTGFGSALEQGDYATAIQKELPRAEQGDASAQSNVGMFYLAQGSEQDKATAFEWLSKSAEQGFTEAESQLGYLYSNGLGVQQDPAKAVYWWRKAAAQRHPSALFNLGQAYADGRGVPRDFSEAYTWFDLAVTNYQNRIYSGFLDQRYLKDAIRARRRAGWNHKWERFLMFLASIGVGTRHPIIQAAKTGNVDEVKQFLEKGVDVDTRFKDGSTPLIFALSYGHRAVAELLIEKGADVNSRTKHRATPLHIAVQTGLDSCVQLLIESGARKNPRSCRGETPLHLAAANDHASIMEVLIKNGGELNETTNEGITPLHVAIQEGHIAMARTLLNKGAKVDAQGGHGQTPLHTAAYTGHVALLELLLANGADPNERSAEGMTPLYMTAFQGNTEVAGVLLKAGARVSIKATDGTTALMVAEQKDHTELVELLRKAGAKE